MELTLPTKLEAFVRSQVRSGRYVDSQEVVRDALRRMQEQEVVEELSGVPGLVHEALVLAVQAQQDVLALTQGEGVTTDWLHELLGYATSALNTALDVARHVPLARDVERRLRGSIEQLTAAAERGENQSRQLRAGLEATSKALAMLTAVLQKVNAATEQVRSPDA